MTRRQRAKALLILLPALLLAVLSFLCDVVGDAAARSASALARWADK